MVTAQAASRLLKGFLVGHGQFHQLEIVNALSRRARTVELSTHPGYMDEFVAACFLPHTDAGLFPSSVQE